LAGGSAYSKEWLAVTDLPTSNKLMDLVLALFHYNSYAKKTFCAPRLADKRRLASELLFLFLQFMGSAIDIAAA
jgi:hypothetical protein